MISFSSFCESKEFQTGIRYKGKVYLSPWLRHADLLQNLMQKHKLSEKDVDNAMEKKELEFGVGTEDGHWKSVWQNPWHNKQK